MAYSVGVECHSPLEMTLGVSGRAQSSAAFIKNAQRIPTV